MYLLFNAHKPNNKRESNRVLSLRGHCYQGAVTAAITEEFLWAVSINNSVFVKKNLKLHIKFNDIVFKNKILVAYGIELPALRSHLNSSYPYSEKR